MDGWFIQKKILDSKQRTFLSNIRNESNQLINLQASTIAPLKILTSTSKQLLNIRLNTEMHLENKTEKTITFATTFKTITKIEQNTSTKNLTLINEAEVLNRTTIMPMKENGSKNLLRKKAFREDLANWQSIPKTVKKNETNLVNFKLNVKNLLFSLH